MVVDISKNNSIDITQLVQYILILYIAYLIYQIIKKEVGGSWGFEELVIGLLIANLGYSFFINSKLQKHLGKHSISDKQFGSLCKDFKELKEKIKK